MAKYRGDESPLEQGHRDTEVRRDTAVRGSLGAPPSGPGRKVTSETDVFREQPEPQRDRDAIRGSLEEAGRKVRKSVEKIGKRIKSERGR